MEHRGLVVFSIIAVVAAVVTADLTTQTMRAGDCVCSTTTVNARSAAGLSGSVVTSVSSGSCGTIYGGELTRDGYKWYEIKYNGQALELHLLEEEEETDERANVILGASRYSDPLRGRTCHGNINNLHPTGKSSGGVAASQREVSGDVSYLNRQKSCYQASADKHCIQASLLAAIASRESAGGAILVSTGGYGDHGHGWGIMQCDIYTSGLPCKNCAWDSCCHIEMVVSRELIPYINQVKNKHPSWSQDQAMQGGVAAYNFGVSNVRSWGGLDIGTAHNDYSNDVIARAQWLYKQGWN